MGSGTIQANLGDGLYSIKIDRAEDLIQEKIDWLDEQIQLIEEMSNPPDSQLTRLTVLQKRKDLLEALLENEPIQLWCADCSLSQGGVVNTIEINGEQSHQIIAPASPGFQTILPGDITPILAQSSAQAGSSWALFPGWQKWKPTYRIGEITSIDHTANTCDIDLDEAYSYINGESINQSDTLSGVSIYYMSCNSRAFVVGDRVAIEFVGQDWNAPQVIGFETYPQPCDLTFPIVISNQDDSLAFAWNGYTNSLLLAVDTLENILGKLSDMGFGDSLKAEYDTVNEVWEYLNDPSYDGAIDQGVYYSGWFEYLDWDITDSHHQPNDRYVSGTFKREWDYRYMEAPDFSKDAGLPVSDYEKGLQAVILQRFPDFLDTDKRDEFMSLSGNTWASPVFYYWFQTSLVPRERVQYFCHAMFDLPISGQYLIKENLDISFTQLLDNWSEVDGGGFSYPGMDPFAGYNMGSTGGLAETDEGAVAYECYQACTHVPLDEDDCDDEDFYDRRVFYLYGHMKDHLSGVPLALFDLVNEYRVDNGRDPLALNFGITKAANRHALDCAENDLEQETGSDGSSLQDRLEDAGYYIGVRTGLVTVSKTQLMEVGSYLSASNILSAWQGDPAANAALLNSDYFEMSIDLQTGETGLDYVVLVLGGVPYRWPGFCPIDTTDIDLYMAENFPNGVDDYFKLPNVRICESPES